jgi:hypothetical protein
MVCTQYNKMQKIGDNKVVYNTIEELLDPLLQMVH